jgi:uncharacterized protein (UPF0332 family)
VQRVVSAVHEVEPRARVILYGSRARGDASEESDWDLLVLLDGEATVARMTAVGDRLHQLMLDTSASLQPIVHGVDEWDAALSRVSPFHQNVERDGIDVTEASAGSTRRAGFTCNHTPLSEKQMAEARDQLMRQWLTEAAEALIAAQVLADARLWNPTVNRLYYACFYAVTALLLRDGYTFSKHGSVQSLFNLHYARTGIMPADLAALYNQLYEGRLKADYVAGLRFDEAQVRPWLEATRRFLAHVNDLLNPPA